MAVIIIYAGLWFIAGYTVGVFIHQFINLPLGAFQGGVLGMLVGLIALIPVISTERGRRLFYEGPDENEDTNPLIGCLFVTPLIIVLIVFIVWLQTLVW